MEKRIVLVCFAHFDRCGDQALHFSTQTWITSTSPHHKLGRNIAIYGMSFSVGFGAGPLFVPLVEVFEALPFIISGILCLIAWSLVFFLRNDFPEHSASSMGAKGTLQRFRTALVIGWVAFLPPLGYGFWKPRSAQFIQSMLCANLSTSAWSPIFWLLFLWVQSPRNCHLVNSVTASAGKRY